jgi:hypothetical protein
MQERRHVKTTPGEPHAVPEYTPHAVRREEGGNVQMDDINIPLVAVIVAFFAVLLAVTIVSLQAWFYNRQTAERQRQTLAQDDPATELGALWAKQRHELNDAPGWARSMAVATTGPATGSSTGTSQPAAKKRIPIDEGMAIVEKEYSAARSGGGGR